MDSIHIAGITITGNMFCYTQATILLSLGLWFCNAYIKYGLSSLEADFTSQEEYECWRKIFSQAFIYSSAILIIFNILGSFEWIKFVPLFIISAFNNYRIAKTRCYSDYRTMIALDHMSLSILVIILFICDITI